MMQSWVSIIESNPKHSIENFEHLFCNQFKEAKIDFHFGLGSHSQGRSVVVVLFYQQGKIEEIFKFSIVSF